MFKAKRRTIVITAAAAVVLVAGAVTVTLTTRSSDAASYEIVNGSTITYAAGHRPAVPAVTAASLTGTPIKLSSYRGRTVVLNFWGSWCAPCREEAPTLAFLAEADRAKDVAFLGDDTRDTPTGGLGFAKEYGITYPSFNDSSGLVIAEIGQVAPVDFTPTTVVIDKTGHIAGLVVGKASYSDLTALIKDAAVVT